MENWKIALIVLAIIIVLIIIVVGLIQLDIIQGLQVVPGGPSQFSATSGGIS